MKNNKPIDWNKINERRAQSIKKYQEKQREKLRSQPKKEIKSKPIPLVSQQQSKLNKIYAILASELKAINTKCEGNLPDCMIHASTIHHSMGRRGLLLILSKYYKYLCIPCHRYCTEHSKEAIALGLSLPINSNPKYTFTEREIELINRFEVHVKV